MDGQILEAIKIFPVTLITNPFIIDKIFLKLGLGKLDYNYLGKLVFPILGSILVFIFVTLMYKYMNLESTVDPASNYVSLLKLVMYIYYLAMLFCFKAEDKYERYRLFGLFYLVCIILSFLSDDINKVIVDLLNMTMKEEEVLDICLFKKLIDSFLTPIKEAILTYIIFDTVTKDKKEENDNQIKQNIDDDLDVERQDANKILLLDKTDANSFKVNVLDNDSGQVRDYQIQVNKR